MKTDLINQLDIQQRGSLIHYLKDNETFINVLYKEFIETPKKRDFNKYIEKVEHLTSQLKAHQEGKLRNDPIARVSFETDYHEQERIFFSKKDSEISESYLTHRLEDTLLYKTVQKIETVLQNAKKVQAPVKPQCKILINLINALDLSIRRTVANEVIKYLDETNEFIFLNILSIKGGSLSLNEAKREEHLHSAESWELSKIEFQDFLIEYLKELPKEKQGVRVEDVEVSEDPEKEFIPKDKFKKDFYSFVMGYWRSDEKRLKLLKAYLNRKMDGLTPKESFYIIKVLKELKILDPTYKKKPLYISMINEFNINSVNLNSFYNADSSVDNDYEDIISQKARHPIFHTIQSEIRVAIADLDIAEDYIREHSVLLSNDKE